MRCTDLSHVVAKESSRLEDAAKRSSKSSNHPSRSLIQHMHSTLSKSSFAAGTSCARRGHRFETSCATYRIVLPERRHILHIPNCSPSTSSSQQLLEPTMNSNVLTPRSVTEFVAETKLPTDRGAYRVRAYRHHLCGMGVSEPLCVIHGDIEGKSAVPLRVHDACFTSEVLGSLKCDCKQQLDLALDYIMEKDGMVIYLQQEGRGIGLANKIAAYRAQEGGLDTVDANRSLGLPDDSREYSAVANILKDLGVLSVKLMTNNPRKISELEREGVIIVDRIPCIVQPNLFSRGYLEAKERRMNHALDGSWCYWGDHAGRDITNDRPIEGDYGDASATFDDEK